jgi:hypothetical protein
MQKFPAVLHLIPTLKAIENENYQNPYGSHSQPAILVTHKRHLSFDPDPV